MTRFVVMVLECFLGGCGSQSAPATDPPLAATGPASGKHGAADPDGNPILIDQRVPRPRK